jgi:hypothetical protein
MAPKTKPQLEEENAALTAQVNSLQQQLGTVTAELGTVTAERNGLQARLVNIEADAVKLKASMETVSTGHFDSYRRITEHEAATAAKIASLEALVLRGPRERTWAERAETASADARRAPAVAARPPPSQSRKLHNNDLKEGSSSTSTTTSTISSSPSPASRRASLLCTPPKTSPLIRRSSRSRLAWGATQQRSTPCRSCHPSPALQQHPHHLHPRQQRRPPAPVPCHHHLLPRTRSSCSLQPATWRCWQ